MKKIILLLTAGILLPLISAAQKTELKFNLEQGKTYYQETVSEMAISQIMMGMTIDMTTTVGTSTSFLVKAARDGHYDIDMKYDKLSMAMKSPYGTIDTSSDDDEFSSMFKSFIDTPFSVKMSERGKVLEIRGLEQIISNMMRDISATHPEQAEQISATLSQNFSPEAIRKNIESSTAMFPERSVSVGESWTNTMSINTMVNLDMVTTYTFAGEENGCYRIDGISQLKFDDEGDKYTEINGMQVKYRVEGVFKVVSLIDKKSGWITSATVDTDMKMLLFLDMGPAQEVEVPVAIKGTTTITGR